MTFTLEKVVPWGRSYEEYLAMFSLTDDDLNKNILGCSDGPASFNAQLSRRDGKVLSIDPLYQFSKHEIQKRIDETFTLVIEQTRKNKDEFNWQYIRDVDELATVRAEAMTEFIEDFSNGKEEGRYVAASLPLLPFEDKAFELALCSHFLFLYSEQYSLDFHLDSIEELCRVASEVRIFPLLELGSRPSRHLEDLLKALEAREILAVIEKVD
ncbi:MAG: SAM-dependent methyltransferase, partial [Gammaproteobacteria bacterium]|nr:SAM-dependent methyltransferase [Gammaproteobacteria bacterium]